MFEDGQFAVQDLKPKGGGGTDGAVLFDYLREKNINPAAWALLARASAAAVVAMRAVLNMVCLLQVCARALTMGWCTVRRATQAEASMARASITSSVPA